MPELAALANRYAAWLMLGLACYGLSLLVWIKALGQLPLSVAYPLLSVSYVLVYLAATNLPGLDEVASWQRSGGVAFIVLGVALVTWPAPSGRVG